VEALSRPSLLTVKHVQERNGNNHAVDDATTKARLSNTSSTSTSIDLRARNYSELTIDNTIQVRSPLPDCGASRSILRPNEINQTGSSNAIQRHRIKHRTEQDKPLSFRSQQRAPIEPSRCSNGLARKTTMLFNPASDSILPKLATASLKAVFPPTKARNSLGDTSTSTETSGAFATEASLKPFYSTASDAVNWLGFVLR